MTRPDSGIHGSGQIFSFLGKENLSRSPEMEYAWALKWSKLIQNEIHIHRYVQTCKCICKICNTTNKKLLDVQSILEYKEHATKVKNLSFFQENSFLKIYQTESVECIDLFSVTKS